MSTYKQGTHQVERLSIARVGGVPTIADVTDAEFALSKRGVVRLTKAFGLMTVSEDTGFVYIDVDQVPSDSAELAGEYTATWRAVVDGKVIVADGGARTIEVSVLS